MFGHIEEKLVSSIADKIGTVVDSESALITEPGRPPQQLGRRPLEE